MAIAALMKERKVETTKIVFSGEHMIIVRNEVVRAINDMEKAVKEQLDNHVTLKIHLVDDKPVSLSVGARSNIMAAAK